MSRIDALKISWPTPAKASPIAPAKAATNEAPTTPGRHADGDDRPAARHAPGHRQNDADDEAGLDNFAKDNDQRPEHRRFLFASDWARGHAHLTIRKPSVVSSW